MFTTRKVVRELSICLFSSHCFFKATVEVSDSFSGVPNVARQEDHPEFKDIPDEMRNLDMKQWGGQVTERGIDGHMTEKNILTVEGRFVEDNFKRFGLLDDKVKFLVGYFNDTLPTVRDRGLSKIALLRAHSCLCDPGSGEAGKRNL